MQFNASSRWIRLARRLPFDPLFFDARKNAWFGGGGAALAFYVDLLCMASWEARAVKADGVADGVFLGRGQLLVSLRFLQRRWGVTQRTVAGFLRSLERGGKLRFVRSEGKAGSVYEKVENFGAESVGKGESVESGGARAYDGGIYDEEEKGWFPVPVSLFQYDVATDRRSYLLEHSEEAARYLAMRARNVEGDVRVKDLAGLWHCVEAEALRSLRGFREAGLMEVEKLNQHRAVVAFPPVVGFSFNKSDKRSADGAFHSADGIDDSAICGGTRGAFARHPR